jgi:hypothetical protein
LKSFTAPNSPTLFRTAGPSKDRWELSSSHRPFARSAWLTRPGCSTLITQTAMTPTPARPTDTNRHSPRRGQQLIRSHAGPRPRTPSPGPIRCHTRTTPTTRPGITDTDHRHREGVGTRIFGHNQGVAHALIHSPGHPRHRLVYLPVPPPAAPPPHARQIFPAAPGPVMAGVRLPARPPGDAAAPPAPPPLS